MRKISVGLFIMLAAWSCKEKPKTDNVSVEIVEIESDIDPLPSFNESDAKTQILSFVERVTDEYGPDYVAPEDRIVCFDNDGTLWVEQPLPSQIYFDFHRIKELAKDHKDWQRTMPYKAIISNDTAAIAKFHLADIVKIVGAAHATENVSAFDAVVDEWLKTSVHPVLKKPYTALVYQPMLELLDFLRENDFKTYIVSGGSQEFMRAWVPESYGIPEEQIIGSTFKTEVVVKGDSLNVAQTETFEFNDDHEGKVISIHKFIGKKPIMIVGNSDGDLEMMEYAYTDNPLPTLMLYVNHTDGQREFLYDDNTLAGKLIKGKEVANKNGWPIIDMKSDWNTIFP